MMDKRYPRYDIMRISNIMDSITGEEICTLMIDIDLRKMQNIILECNDINRHIELNRPQFRKNLYDTLFKNEFKRELINVVNHSITMYHKFEEKLYNIFPSDNGSLSLSSDERNRIKINAFVNNSKEMCDYMDKEYKKINVLNEV